MGGPTLLVKGGGKCSGMGTLGVNTRYEGGCKILVDSFEQVIAKSVDDQLYGPLPGPARVYLILSGHQLLESSFGRHSGTCLGFAAMLLRLTEESAPRQDRVHSGGTWQWSVEPIVH